MMMYIMARINWMLYGLLGLFSVSIVRQIGCAVTDLKYDPGSVVYLSVTGRRSSGGGAADLLTHHPEIPDLEKEDQELLEEILAAPSAAAAAAQPGPWHTEGTQELAAGGVHELQVKTLGGVPVGGGELPRDGCRECG